MKFKCFQLRAGLLSGVSRTPEELDDDVNRWLSENPGIDVVDIKQSSAGPGNHRAVTTITIWYEPKE